MSFSDSATGMRAPVVVWALAVAIVATYAAFAFAPTDVQNSVDYAFALIPERFHPGSAYGFKHWYEYPGPILGHVFLHAGWWHAGLNAFFFFLLGRVPAQRLGPARFLALFILSAIGGAVAYVAIAWNSGMPAVGASGAVCGVFTAYYMALPPRWTMALRDSRIRNQWFMIFFINVVLMGLASELGWFPIAWQAHLGGFVAGGLAYAALAPKPARGPWSDLQLQR